MSVLGVFSLTPSGLSVELLCAKSSERFRLFSDCLPLFFEDFLANFTGFFLTFNCVFDVGACLRGYLSFPLTECFLKCSLGRCLPPNVFSQTSQFFRFQLRFQCW